MEEEKPEMKEPKIDSEEKAEVQTQEEIISPDMN